MFMNLIDNAPTSLDYTKPISNTSSDDSTVASTIQNALHNKANRSTTYAKTETTYL